MCGIAGKLNFDTTVKVEESHIRAMIQPMAHRGPDADGIHLDRRRVGLGEHLRRLSIIDT